MKKILLTTMAALGLCLGASADVIAQWTFNDGDGDATTGTLFATNGISLASLVGTVTNNFTAAAGSSDPLGTGTDNSNWRIANFPPQGTGNKTCGAQFALDTRGYANISLAWDQQNSATANKYWRVQYSTDNGTTWVEKDLIINTLSAAWNKQPSGGFSASFASVAGAGNNTNFLVRIMSEFASTAVGGAASYVAVGGGTYGINGTFRLDMVTFSGDFVGDNLTILTDPINQAVAEGQPASFSVVAGGGTGTITYQWRKNTSPVPNATNSIYGFAAAQLTDAASYDVIVASGANSLTSAVATLTVRVPLNLAWTGMNGATWDTTTVSWVDTNSTLPVAYTDGDHVLFDDRTGATSVSLVGSLTPNSVTVNYDFDYVLRSDVGGKIVGNTGITKRGAGTLTLDTDNSYSGPTVIQAGAVQLGAADAHGSMGSGSVTNNGGLVFNRTDTLVVGNKITSNGGITNIGKVVSLVGANVYNGPIYVASGSMDLSGNLVMNSTDLMVAASGSGSSAAAISKLSISGNQTVGAGTTLRYLGTSGPTDQRAAFASTSGTNTFNGPLVAEGSGACNLNAEGAGTVFIVNGNVTGPNFAGGTFFLRGATGSGILNGTIDLPSHVVNKTDSGTWTINSTGNSWAASVLAVGTLRIGANNALPVGMTMQFGQVNVVATLDLAGFNQQLAVLVDSATFGIQIITNSSATADSTLTVGSGYFSGTIADSAAGRKTGLTLNGGAFALLGTNTYSGETTVAAGTLSLKGEGNIPNSTAINLAGGTMDVSTRNDASLNLGAAQTLKGNGTLAVTGNLSSGGTIELKVNKAGAVSNDKVAVTGVLTCGGTLKLVLSGQALNWTDTLQVFDAAGGYSGIIPVINPAVPAPGAKWDTSTLLSDGKLRIYGPPTVTSTVISGGNVTLSGLGGTAFGTFSVLTSTNVAAPAAGWVQVQTGSFDASGNFNVSIAMTPGEPQRFYKLQMP